jgi:hypothetical protein
MVGEVMKKGETGKNKEGERNAYLLSPRNGRLSRKYKNHCKCTGLVLFWCQLNRTLRDVRIHCWSKVKEKKKKKKKMKRKQKEGNCSE